MTNPRPCRAIPIDGTEFVYGWYCCIQEYEFSEPKHLIIEKNARLVNPNGGICINVYPSYYIDRWVEVQLITLGQQVGLKDKNGKDLDWWEGDLFEMHGRTTLFRLVEKDGCYWLRSSETKERFPCHQIIKYAQLPEKLGDSQTITSDNSNIHQEEKP